MKISFVVAVYQNAGALTETHRQIMALFDEQLEDYEPEIIFVNDGSSDGSLDELREIKQADADVRIVSFTRNFGQMAAMLAGFKEATGDAVINISADLQDPVDLIPEMVGHWKSGSEIVICYRTNRSDPVPAKVFSWAAYSMLRAAVPQIPRGGFDFVLMNRVAMDQFNSMDTRHRFFQGDLLWPGYKASFIPYTRKERTIGKSQYNFTKKMKNFMDAMLDSSFIPIRAISLIGLLTSILGVFYSISIIISWFRGETPFDGWAPIMIAILIIGGLIMVMLGIIGEYIWRINEEVRKRPNYVIKEKF